MASLKSKLLIGLMRNSHLFRLKLKRPAFDSSPDGIKKFRRQTEKAAKRFGKLPSGISIVPEQVGEMYAEWVKVLKAPKDKTILYFHGGIYIIGSPQGHRPHVSKFVDGSKINAFVFDYRLAPEFPFPAAVEDSVAAYSYLLNKGFKPANIVFVGDSAGGGLCLATLNALKQNNSELPSAAVVLSPWTDLKLSGGSYSYNAKKCLSPEGSAQDSSRLYAGEKNREDPLISPLYGNLEGLPPIHMSVGTNEILLDDTLAYAEKAKKAGVPVTLEIGEGMCHCYPVFGNMFKESKQTMNNICDFIRTQLPN